MGALIGYVEGIEVKKGWLPPDSAVPVLDIYLVERKTCPCKESYTNVHSSIIHNRQKLD